MTVLIIVIVALVLLAGLIYILIRNGIIGSRNRVDEAWSGIDVQLKRRHDLVPNLVETVKGYAQHEQRVFEETTKARAEAMSAQGVDATRSPSRGSPPRSPTCVPSPRTIPTCARPRTSSASRPISTRSRTRSRPRAGSTTQTSSPTTPRSRSSRTRSSPTRAASPHASSSRSRRRPSASRSRSPSPSRPAAADSPQLRASPRAAARLHPPARSRGAGQPAQGAPAGRIGSPVSTTSNAVPGTSLSWLRFSSSQRASVEPLMYQLDPLSATIAP